MSNEIEFCAEISWETDNAYLLSDGMNEFWIPKSQVIDKDKVSDGNYNFTIPEWLAIDKGIV